MKYFFYIIVCCFLLLSKNIGADFFVSTNSNLYGFGNVVSNVFQSELIKPGDRVLFNGGDYYLDGTNNVLVAIEGNKSKQTVFAALSNQTVNIYGSLYLVSSFITLSNLNLISLPSSTNAAIRIGGVGITIENCKATGFETVYHIRPNSLSALYPIIIKDDRSSNYLDFLYIERVMGLKSLTNKSDIFVERKYLKN